MINTYLFCKYCRKKVKIYTTKAFFGDEIKNIKICSNCGATIEKEK